MSQTRSPATGQIYGTQRVCKAFQLSRSNLYYHLGKRDGKPQLRSLKKRGPKTDLTDAQVVELIREDLGQSPFQGEGYRKVWARLKVKGHRIGANRILRLMRVNNLLSPHRTPKGEPNEHDGTIQTTAPNVMWGTDAARIPTVNDGYVWFFGAVEHWNAECVGWHVSKEGIRFNALEPIAMGLKEIFGSTLADVARGLSLRMDHGPQYTSDHFQEQIRYWGVAPSFAYVREPETNGVIERFNRTLKEQAIYGRVFKDIEEVRSAVGEFVKNYNAHWRLEKLNYRSPHEMRQAAHLPLAA